MSPNNFAAWTSPEAQRATASAGFAPNDAATDMTARTLVRSYSSTEGCLAGATAIGGAMHR
ncbi:hypothetical protein APR11_005386 [Nocardia amikacinitolerans]|nr:hypothetical protein [Nocardia amikacinitolerans]